MGRIGSGTEAGSKRTAASGNNQCSVEEPFADSCWIDMAVPYRPCWDDEEVQTKRCSRWRQTVDDRFHQEQDWAWASRAAGRNCQALLYDGPGHRLLPHRTHPSLWTTCSHDASCGHHGGCGHGSLARRPFGSKQCSLTSQGTSWLRKQQKERT